MNIKKKFGAAIKIIIALIVIAFLGMKSLDFFLFTTPADQWYLSWLGFGLTGGGVLAYLLIFMWDADTDLKKFISIVMLGVCVFGELATAGFGMQVDTWQKTGFQMAQSDFQAMVFAVQLLGFAHAIALIAYVAGDLIGDAFQDKNKNGIPDGFERKNKGQQNEQPHQQHPQNNQPAHVNTNAADAELVELRATVKRLQSERDTPKGTGQS